MALLARQPHRRHRNHRQLPNQKNSSRITHQRHRLRKPHQTHRRRADRPHQNLVENQTRGVRSNPLTRSQQLQSNTYSNSTQHTAPANRQGLCAITTQLSLSPSPGGSPQNPPNQATTPTEQPTKPAQKPPKKTPQNAPTTHPSTAQPPYPQ